MELSLCSSLRVYSVDACVLIDRLGVLCAKSICACEYSFIENKPSARYNLIFVPAFASSSFSLTFCTSLGLTLSAYVQSTRVEQLIVRYMFLHFGLSLFFAYLRVLIVTSLLLHTEQKLLFTCLSLIRNKTTFL